MLEDRFEARHTGWRRWSPSRGSEEALSQLRQEKPQGVSDQAWLRVQDDARRQYVRILHDEVVRQKDGAARYLKEQDLSFLEDLDRRLLYSDAARVDLVLHTYRVLESDDPLDYLGGADLSELDTIDELRLTKLAKRIAETEALYDTIQRVVIDGHVLDDRPAELDSVTWRKIKEMEPKIARLSALEESEQAIAQRESVVTRRENEALKEEQRISTLGARVQRQIGFVNELLEDPSLIDRIEPYDNLFSPGNYAILRKMASAMRNQTITDGEEH